MKYASRLNDFNDDLVRMLTLIGSFVTQNRTDGLDNIILDIGNGNFRGLVLRTDVFMDPQYDRHCEIALVATPSVSLLNRSNMKQFLVGILKMLPQKWRRGSSHPIREISRHFTRQLIVL